jgi:hypothetical protein
MSENKTGFINLINKDGKEIEATKNHLEALQEYGYKAEKREVFDKKLGNVQVIFVEVNGFTEGDTEAFAVHKGKGGVEKWRKVKAMDWRTDEKQRQSLDEIFDANNGVRYDVCYIVDDETHTEDGVTLPVAVPYRTITGSIGDMSCMLMNDPNHKRASAPKKPSVNRQKAMDIAARIKARVAARAEQSEG